VLGVDAESVQFLGAGTRAPARDDLGGGLRVELCREESLPDHGLRSDIVRRNRREARRHGEHVVVPLQPGVRQEFGLCGARHGVPTNLGMLRASHRATQRMCDQLGTEANGKDWHATCDRSSNEVDFCGDFLLVALPIHRPFGAKQNYDVDTRERFPIAWVLSFVALEREAQLMQSRANQPWLSVPAVADEERNQDDITRLSRHVRLSKHCVDYTRQDFSTKLRCDPASNLQ